MKKFLQKKLKEQKGMTLIELLAVIVIIAIIAAIAIPAIAGIIENSRVGAIKSDATNILNAAELYLADGGAPTDATNGTVTLKNLMDLNFIEDANSFETNPESTTIKLSEMSISGTGSLNNGDVTVEFLNADKGEISSYGNSERDAEATVAIPVAATVK